MFFFFDEEVDRWIKAGSVEIGLGPTGVTLRIKGVMSALSGHYPWKYVPKAMATLMVLYGGAPELSLSIILAKARAFLGMSQDELYDFLFPIWDDIDTIYQKRHEILMACPKGEVREELKRLVDMDTMELGVYLGDEVKVAS